MFYYDLHPINMSIWYHCAYLMPPIHETEENSPLPEWDGMGLSGAGNDGTCRKRTFRINVGGPKINGLLAFQAALLYVLRSVGHRPQPEISVRKSRKSQLLEGRTTVQRVPKVLREVA